MILRLILTTFFIFVMTDCSNQIFEPKEDVPQDSLVTMADKKAIE